jgi:hypothetical protein
MYVFVAFSKYLNFIFLSDLLFMYEMYWPAIINQDWNYFQQRYIFKRNIFYTNLEAKIFSP